VDNLKGPDQIMDKIRKFLFNIIKSDEFEVRDSGLLALTALASMQPPLLVVLDVPR
jgi:hypothetical protein